MTGCNPQKLIAIKCDGNPGRDGKFVVKAWFDTNTVPSTIVDYTKTGWEYGSEGETIEIVYENVMNK